MRALWLLVLLVLQAPTAGAISPVLSSISPAGGKAGTDVEFTLSGSRLNDAKEILLYSAGLQVVSLEAKKTNQIKAILHIQPDCPPGEHQLRVRTLTGLTELRTLYVGPFTSMKETEPNNELSKAQIVPVNTTVTGIITSEDIDFFKIEGKKGQRISAEVEAMQLGRVMFDPYLAILDPEGKQLAECDDSIFHLQDPMISILAPRDGFYYVLLRDTSWGGGNDFIYRLHLGNFPRPTAVYPPGGPAGTDLQVTFLGDPSGPITRTLKLPKTGDSELRAVAESGGVPSPSPNRVRVVSFPNILESGDNHQLAQAVLATQDPPFAFNGIISEAKEQDWFGFRAQKKQALEITVYARRLRSPLDPVLQICDSKGKVIDSNDDSVGQDSALKFTPEESGTYYLRINDQLGGGGADYVYRIEVQPPSPGVVLSIPEVARNDTQTRQAISVPRGGRMATLINAKRSSFNGDLTFLIPGLPAGVSLLAEPMPAGVDIMPWVFSAGTDAPLAAALVEPMAHARSADKHVTSRYRHTLELIRGNNDQVYYGTHSDRLAVAVVQEVPFQLTLEIPSVPLVRAGSMKLKVKAERRSGFDEPINLKLIWNPPGIGSETEVTLPKGKTTAEYAINAKADASLATWKIVVLGSAAYQGGTAFASSELTPLRVTEPFIVGKITPANTEPGKPVQIKCTLEQKEPFEGKAIVRLLGLPEKATAAEKEITKSDKEVIFDVTLDPNISPGSHKNLSCQIQIKKGEDILLQSVGNGGILRIVPAKKGSPDTRKVASSQSPNPAK